MSINGFYFNFEQLKKQKHRIISGKNVKLGAFSINGSDVRIMV